MGYDEIVNKSPNLARFLLSVQSQSDYEITPETLLYSETGIEEYDSIKPQSKWDWLVKAVEIDNECFVGGRVGYLNDNSKVHLLIRGDSDELYLNSGYDTFCHYHPNKMRVRLTTHVDISKNNLCKKCMTKKKRLVGALIALRSTA